MQSDSLYQTDEVVRSSQLRKNPFFIEKKKKKIPITIFVTTFWEAESVSLQIAEPSM